MAKLKSGVYRYINQGILLKCQSCPTRDDCPEYNVELKQCPLLLRYREEIQELIENEGHTTPADSLLISLLLKNLTVIAILDLYISKYGLVTVDNGKIDMQPCLRCYWSALNSANRELADLGLSATARYKIGLGQEDEKQSIGSRVRNLALRGTVAEDNNEVTEDADIEDIKTEDAELIN